MRTILFAILFASAWGCTSIQNNAAVGPIEESVAQKGAETVPAQGFQPYVEGFIEFSGPQARWSGPTSFVLHVHARDVAAPFMSVSPDLFKELSVPPTTEENRKLASTGISGERVREELAGLATSLQGGDLEFKGCISPVRVRLIRADGFVLERQGCRSSQGWPKAASQAVHFFVSSGLKGAN